MLYSLRSIRVSSEDKRSQLPHLPLDIGTQWDADARNTRTQN